MRNFQCSKCKRVVQKDSEPSSSNCPEATYHTWYDLSEVGSTEYQCRNCGTVIEGKANTVPKSFGCPDGNFHTWNKI